ncbi:hypothetical protein OESDEN_19310 [Oesophagostomum dentatum]|uniref:Peptidase A1 domain-containing protein n=1 Tax=Oesophagostomum dentatum TaxID=61180 RepID=A0A0B1S6N2_OESDE|nr:hypothetical protein OESDEN_19310 [Oesophagostomum dentatum]
MHRAAKQRLIDSPVFTVFLRYSKDADINSGLFTYGGVDNENCGPVIEYQSLTDSYYWQFHIGAVSAGNYTSNKGWDAISDTGTALIGVPDEILLEITKAVGAKVYGYVCGTPEQVQTQKYSTVKRQDVWTTNFLRAMTCPAIENRRHFCVYT